MPSKETRTVISLGSKNKSLAITLPAPWVNYHKIKQGQKISLIYNGVLVVCPDKEHEEKITELMKI